MNETDLNEMYHALHRAKTSKPSDEEVLKLSRAAGEVYGYTLAFAEAIKDVANMNAFNSAFNSAFKKTQQSIQMEQNPKEAVDKAAKKQKVSFEKPSGPVKQFHPKTDSENKQ